MRLLVILLCLVACAKKESVSLRTEIKSIHSVWQSGGPNWTMDLTDQNHIVFSYGAGTVCKTNSSVTWIYDENFGLLAIASVATISSAAGDPPCSMFLQLDLAKYQNLASGNLEVCPADPALGCIVFK